MYAVIVTIMHVFFKTGSMSASLSRATALAGGSAWQGPGEAEQANEGG